jgi:hypothetical protein
MSYDIEKKLHTVQTQSLTEAEKSSVWFSIVSKQESQSGQKKLLELFFSKKYMIATLLALVVILGGGGVVVASNSALPGDTLYPVDQAVENIQIKLASSEDKKSELKVKFAEERLSEVETFVKRGSSNVQDVDLSSAVVTEIEVDVFTNETTVKIEADDKHYGFVASLRDKDAIVAEIQEKYKLTDEQINAVLSFETEDRSSQADDKEFLNSASSVTFKSDKQRQEFEGSLTEVSDLIANSSLSEEEKARLTLTLAGIMALLETNPDLEMEFKTSDGFKLEVEDGKVEIKTNNGVSDKKDEDEDEDEDSSADIREDQNEVFCRGEWRDSEDCVESDSDESDDDSGSDDSEDESDDDSDNDNNDSDDDSDDDNSGSGKDDDDENDDNDSEDDSNDDNDDDNESEDDDEDNGGSGDDDND